MTSDVIVIGLSVIIILFGFVVLFGAPYLPTLSKQIDVALDMLDLKKGDTMLELGSGDGRVLRAAAQRGIKCVGYELNPLLVIYSKIVCWRYRKLVTVKLGSYWGADWPQADGIYVFLLQKYMDKLDTKIIQHVQERGAVRVVSFASTIKNKQPVQQHSGISLYAYGAMPTKKKR